MNSSNKIKEADRRGRERERSTPPRRNHVFWMCSDVFWWGGPGTHCIPTFTATHRSRTRCSMCSTSLAGGVPGRGRSRVCVGPGWRAVGPSRHTGVAGRQQAVRLRPELPRAGRRQTGPAPRSSRMNTASHGPRRTSAKAKCARCRAHMVAPCLGAALVGRGPSCCEGMSCAWQRTMLP